MMINIIFIFEQWTEAGTDFVPHTYPFSRTSRETHGFALNAMVLRKMSTISRIFSQSLINNENSEKKIQLLGKMGHRYVCVAIEALG